MNRLEIIHLRLAGECPEELVLDIRRSASALPPQSELTVYRRQRVATDLSIQIVYRRPVEELPSPFGLLLASAMREHGMVEHSVWDEVEAEES